MKILWITPKWPVPTDDGQKIATMALLEPIATRHSLDLICFGSGTALAFAKQSLALLPRKQFEDLFSAFGGMPHTFRRFARNNLRAQAEAWLKSHGPWDALVFDTLHTAALLEDPRKFAKKIYYRAHNVESDLWLQAAKQSWWPQKALLYSQGKRVREFEKKILSTMNAVFPVSENDAQKLQVLAPNATLHTIPIGFSFPDLPLRTPDRFVFIGRLDWPPNRDGLRWFLREVWPEVAQSGERLQIAGSGNGSWLREFEGLLGVELCGRVEAVEPLYLRAKALLAPLFYGSGTRVKAIEASRFGVPVISTELGAEGLNFQPHQHYIRAETKEEWIKALKFFQPNDIGNRANHLLREKFDQKKVAEQFLEFIR